MNQNIISQFELLVKHINNQLKTAQADNDQKEINSNTFRLKSVKRILNILKNLDEEIRDVKQLKGISGIGEGTLKRVEQILSQGYLDELKDLEDYIPGKKEAAIAELEEIIGVGKQTAKEFVNDYGIMSIADLKKAHKKGKIHLDDMILLGLKYHGVVEGKIPYDEITVFKKYAEKVLKKINSDLELTICGSYRRKKPTSGDIDMMIYHPDVRIKEEILDPEEYGFESYLEQFVDTLKEKNIILDDMTNKNYSMKYMGFMKYKEYPVRRLDIRWMPYDSLPTALLYFTGPFELNTIMRNEAKRKGMILNEYGIYKVSDSGKKKLIKVKTEKDVFDKLGMPYLTPEQREYYNTGKNKSVK